MDENAISKVIVESAIEVHRVLGGPGLLESVYEEALAQEPKLRGMEVERQQPVPIIYKGVTLRTTLRLDLPRERSGLGGPESRRGVEPRLRGADARVSPPVEGVAWGRDQLRRADCEERHPPGCERPVIRDLHPLRALAPLRQGLQL